MNNNLFTFATKELSQDAIICWLLNWIKCPNSKLYGISIDMFNILGIQNVNSSSNIEIRKQQHEVDVLIVLHDIETILIIEDKVYAFERENQINDYKTKFMDLNNQKRWLGINCKEAYTVKTVYFKTGFFFDEDKRVQADVIVDYDCFYRVVSNEYYRGISEILDSFVCHLDDMKKWYSEYRNFNKKIDNSEDYYISKEHVAQYEFMRFLFPAERWNRDTGEFMVHIGSSSGRPWAQVNVCNKISHPNGEGEYRFFWRLDTNTQGPYLSLRLYEYLDLKDKRSDSNGAWARHKDLYSKNIGIVKGIIEDECSSYGINWDDVKDRKAENYRESSLISIKLQEYLSNWNNRGETLKLMVNEITEQFLKSIAAQ